MVLTYGYAPLMQSWCRDKRSYARTRGDDTGWQDILPEEIDDGFVLHVGIVLGSRVKRFFAMGFVDFDVEVRLLGSTMPTLMSLKGALRPVKTLCRGCRAAKMKPCRYIPWFLSIETALEKPSDHIST